jgi:biopolymer transport protein TolQ
MRGMNMSPRESGAEIGFTWPVRVYYEDTDAGGIVFYANYLKFFERARTEWLRACGIEQDRLAEETGVLFIVRSTAVDYRAPARLDDLIKIVSRPERIGRASVDFSQEAWRDGTLLATGTIRVGCVDRVALRPAAIPAPVLAALRRGPKVTAPVSIKQHKAWFGPRFADASGFPTASFDGPCSRTPPFGTLQRTYMNTTQDLSIISLVLNASLLAQAVMALLLLLSLLSWTFIFRKWFAIRRARAQTERFERDFWSGGDLQALYQSAANNRHTIGALERIFESGMREFLKGKEKRLNDPGLILDGARRAMRAAFQREMDVLEANLAFLASVGSVSPYIGLFGTVWGIMNAFRGLANVQQATLANVAPGIAEALTATAIGLFAAIPAVVAYNRYAHDIDRLAIRFETFIEEFSNILQRQAH